MDTAFLRFRSLSFWAYICLFGALWGYVTFSASTPVPVNGGTPISGQRELIMLWVPLALLGSMLVGLKNRRIPDRRTRAWQFLADLLITAVLLALIWLVPTFVGLVRSAMVLAVETAYLVVYVNLLDKGSLVARTP